MAPSGWPPSRLHYFASSIISVLECAHPRSSLQQPDLAPTEPASSRPLPCWRFRMRFLGPLGSIKNEPGKHEQEASTRRAKGEPQTGSIDGLGRALSLSLSVGRLLPLPHLSALRVRRWPDKAGRDDAQRKRRLQKGRPGTRAGPSAASAGEKHNARLASNWAADEPNCYLWLARGP